MFDIFSAFPSEFTVPELVHLQLHPQDDDVALPAQNFGWLYSAEKLRDIQL
jgi:hypothetical protein